MSTQDSAEDSRLAALYRYDVLDTPPEESFDRITRLAKIVLQAPLVVVSLIDRDRQWFKSKIGMDATETPRDLAFCNHTIQRETPMLVVDASQDKRFHDHPLVVGEPGIRFYLGVPLRTPDGHNIGTLCAVDYQARQPSQDQVAVLQDLARLVVDELELRQMAVTDSLTGAMTRRGFMREAEKALEQTRRYGHPLSCIALDVDRFKSVNDRYGHPTGDRVLRAIATSCRAVMRAVDQLGRLGGEEFAILLPETSLVGAATTAERVRQQIAATEITTDTGPLSVTASFGVASMSVDADDIAGMLAAADEALYQAKVSGRDRVVVAGAKPPEQ